MIRKQIRNATQPFLPVLKKEKNQNAKLTPFLSKQQSFQQLEEISRM